MEKLEMINISKSFQGVHANRDINLNVASGEVLGLLGENGAGKTTLFNVIAGVLAPTSGKVTMDGEDITGLPPHELFHKGLLRTFQIAHEFSSMSCRENLMMVPPNQMGETIINAWFRRGLVKAQEEEVRAKAEAVGVPPDLCEALWRQMIGWFIQYEEEQLAHAPPRGAKDGSQD